MNSSVCNPLSHFLRRYFDSPNLHILQNTDTLLTYIKFKEIHIYGTQIQNMFFKTNKYETNKLVN